MAPPWRGFLLWGSLGCSGRKNKKGDPSKGIAPKRWLRAFGPRNGSYAVATFAEVLISAQMVPIPTTNTMITAIAFIAPK